MRQARLVALVNPPTSQYAANWSNPLTRSDWLRGSFYADLGRLLERGRFDMVFLADALAVPEDADGEIATTLRTGGKGAIYLDPIVALSHIAAVTTHLGLGATVSTTFQHPFSVARSLLSLDQLSGGRAAWNIVTSTTDAEARNHGVPAIPERSARYDLADEVVQSVIDLWESWEPDALRLDAAGRVFADPDRVHRAPERDASIPYARGPQGRSTYIGSLTINGTERPCEAASTEELRTGMIARCVAIAIRLHRAVRLTVNDSSQTWTLGVRPEGIVQLVDASGTIPPADGLTVHEGRCRICRRLQPVTEAVCVQCHTPEPHRVEADPIDAKVIVPDAATTVEELPAVRPVTVPVEELEHTVMVKPTPPAVTRPRLRLTFTTQEPVDTSEGVVLGRQPVAVGDRKPIAIESPERMLSRTHALVDVDDDGRIIVTDYHSGNGIETQTDPPRRFQPGVPYTIEPGTSLRMGDVVCTVDVVS